LYQEDHDLCLRLVKECGELVLCPGATATHLSRRSSGGKHRYRAEYVRGYHHIQSKFLFAQKHGRTQLPAWRAKGYSILATFEFILRGVCLDFLRAARAAGRMRGAAAYRPKSATKSPAV
jgi:GT2 family glycosyltransferase